MTRGHHAGEREEKTEKEESDRRERNTDRETPVLGCASKQGKYARIVLFLRFQPI